MATFFWGIIFSSFKKSFFLTKLRITVSFSLSLVFLSLCLKYHILIYPSFCFSICLFIFMSVCLFLYIYLCLFIFRSFSIYPYFCLSVLSSIFWSLLIFVFFLYLCIFVYPFHLPLCVYLSLGFYITVSLCLSVSTWFRLSFNKQNHLEKFILYISIISPQPKLLPVAINIFRIRNFTSFYPRERERERER